MDNNAIADHFTLLSKLMDIHGENSFKAKSYSIAAYTIETLPVELSTLSKEKIFAIKNIGENIGQKIIDLQETGSLSILNEYLAKTPEGVLELLKIKGLGPKKIGFLWKESGIESVAELLDACNENRLSSLKGFGEKTQQNIKETIEYLSSHEGRFLFAQVEKYSLGLLNRLKKEFPHEKFALTGDLARQLEIVDEVEFVTTADRKEVSGFLSLENLQPEIETESRSAFRNADHLLISFYFIDPQGWQALVFQKSSSPGFFEEWERRFPFEGEYRSEDDIFLKAGTDYIPPYMREDPNIIGIAEEHKMPPVLQPVEVKAIIHSHSKWSDGAYDIAEMAEAAKRTGLEYLVLTDHSKSAFYANGLSEERIKAQHRQIDDLNEKFAPFKIFKGIESDILNDGSLDYPDAVLASFDLVIASIHSNQKMNEEKATQRLISAIENPFTNILGHMTGRLLLKRKGYPVDHQKIIDACAANNVVIEINANPRRLDIDWRWVDYCLEKGVMLSINPDAHSIEEFENVRYGVLVAQKAGLTRFNNLSSFGLKSFETFLKKQNEKRP